MMQKVSAGAFVVAAVWTLAGATAQATILPDNNLYLEDNLERFGGLTQAEFEGINEKARQLFAPIVSTLGGSLKIRGNWTDSTVNASATQLFGTWQVNMYGGLARRPEVTPEGFTLVLCHEIGHHLAGFPFVSAWGADEGQADYFATTHCAQLFWGEDIAANAAFRDLIPASPKAKCDDVYSTEDAQNLCYRAMMGGKSLGDLLAALRSQTVSFDTPDANVVTATDHSHPAAQCRLDTYSAGALCFGAYDPAVIPGKRGGRGFNDVQAEEQSAIQYCASRDQFTQGTRPLCWFKPGI